MHGSSVVVNDHVWGTSLSFLIAEDDQTAAGCAVGGVITDMDPDDCVSAVLVGWGSTCGSGGGDGLFWVVFVGSNPPPFTGTVTAF